MFRNLNRYMHLYIQCLIYVCLFLIDSDCMSLVYIGNLVYLRNVLVGYCLKGGYYIFSELDCEIGCDV